MGIREVAIEKARKIGLTFNETELAYIVAAIEYNQHDQDEKMDTALAEARVETFLKMQTKRHKAISVFIRNWEKL